MEALKYPIGKFEYGKSYSAADTKRHIEMIERFPKELRTLAEELTPTLLEKSYRENGWTARQVIHHIADSHMNALIRVKLTLTEDLPTIKPYIESKWAELEDVKKTPVNVSILIVENVHIRLVNLLKSLSEADLQRNYFHPQYEREFKLEELIALYAWHGKHHFEHLKIILDGK